LSDQILEVDRAEEDARLRGEEERDRDDPDDHRQASDVARLDRVPPGAEDRADAVLVFGGSRDLGRRGRAHATTSVSSGGGAPNVMASTISCSFVLLRS